MEASYRNFVHSYDYWIKRNWYYHRLLSQFYQFIIPQQKRVLQIGCKTGFLLAQVKPSYGVGIDDDARCVSLARQQYPHLHFFCEAINTISTQEKFDYIILSSTIMEIDDIQEFFLSLHNYCHESTRIVIDYYAMSWEPLLWLAQKCKLRRPTQLNNWISLYDLKNFLYLANFEAITHGRQILLPFYIPIISTILNTLACLPIINWFCLSKWVIARPILLPYNSSDVSISVVIPCRNERGNIEQAVTRCPMLGKYTEIIFAEGNSQDDTIAEIQRVIQKYPEKNISYFSQYSKGKGAAVHQGFAKARGDILIIQDGDLTAPPEELPKFFNALIQRKGEFINGSRLVYGMESEAMRFLNLIANYLFALGFTWLLGQRIKDTLCGTKVLFKKDYENIIKNKDFFGNFDPYGDFDLLFGAAKQNLKILDMPIHYKNRTYGTSQISRFSGGWLLLKMSFIAFKKFKLR